MEAFLRTDAAFIKELDSFRKSNRYIQKDWHPGCTAITALVVRNRLFVAHIGDCRAILCRAGNPIALTEVSWVFNTVKASLIYSSMHLCLN